MRRVIAPSGQVAHLSRSKYGVRTDAAGKLKRTADGIVFDSQAECRRYGELKLLEKARDIRDLKVHPRFALMAPVIRGGLENLKQGTFERVSPIGDYEADFSYTTNGFKAGIGVDTFVVEDVKGGPSTALYRWKKKHMLAQYGIALREVR